MAAIPVAMGSDAQLTIRMRLEESRGHLELKDPAIAGMTVVTE